MTTPALELVHVSKSFGSVLALQDISLAVYPGSVTCVLGDNGAGKSTLIKILSGVHKPTEGEFRVNNEAVSFNSPREALARGLASVVYFYRIAFNDGEFQQMKKMLLMK